MGSMKRDFSHIVRGIGIVVLSFAATAHSDTIFPSRGNAALLYYQAFLLGPDSNAIPDEMVHAVLQEPAVPEDVNRYIAKYKDAVELVKMASSTQQCDWGMIALSSLGAPAEPIVARRSRYVALLVCADARILAMGQNYQGALTDCFAVRRFAAHLSAEAHILEVVPIITESYALYTIRQILNDIPPDERTLSLLADQMASVPPVSDQLWLHIDRRCEQELRWSKNAIVAALRTQAGGRSSVDTSAEEGQPLDDEALFETIHEPFVTYFRLVRDMLESDKPYEQKYAELERLGEKLKKEVPTNPSVMLGLTSAADMAPRLYDLQLAAKSFFNALTVAIELYRAKAVTGQLPKGLQEGLLEDPYSAKAFEYERTPDGFVLRGRIKATDCREPREYKFTVRK